MSSNGATSVSHFAVTPNPYNALSVLVFDSTGTVCWYREFDEGVPAEEVKQQANGDITVFLGATHGGDPLPGRYVELAPDGSEVRTIVGQPPAYTDNHELWLQFSEGAYDGAVMLTYTQRQLDLSAQGGPSDTVVSGHQLVRVAADSTQLTIFDAWNGYGPLDNIDPVPQSMDFDHS